MIRRHKTLFTVQLKHPFYNSGLSSDFGFGMSASTRETLSRFRLRMTPLSKENPSGFKISQEAFDDVSQTPLVPIPEGTAFHFYLFLQNSEMVNFTTLPDLSQGGILYLENQNGQDDLHPEQDKINHLNTIPGVRLRPLTYTYRIFVNGETDLTLEFFENNVFLGNQQATSTDGNFEFKLDFSAQGPGRYTIQHTRTGGGTPQAVTDLDHEIYADNEVNGSGIFALIRVVKTAQTPIDGKAFFVEFLERKEQWQYFLLILNDNTHDYKVEDTENYDSGGEILFSDTTGSIAADPQAKKLKELLEAQNPTATAILRYTSQTKISYKESPKKYISLVRTPKLSGSDKTVSTHLSTPVLSDVSPFVVVSVRKPETLFTQVANGNGS